MSIISGLAVALGTLVFAGAVQAQTTQTTTPPADCGSLCGIPTSTYVVSSEAAGVTFGQSLGMSETSGLQGNTGESGSWANGISRQNIRTGITGAADGCEANCGSVSAFIQAEGRDEREAGSFAMDTGTHQSSAAAASGVQGTSGLMGRMQIGVRPASNTPSN